METRRHERLFLLGHDESQIVGAKLPSKGQVLKVLFYNMRKVKPSLRGSAHLVVKEVEVLWEKARIPIRKIDRSIEKVESLYQDWKILQKGCKRRSPIQERREQEFIDQLDDLFDIAHRDALEIMNIEEDKQFLLNQRKKGRPGSMIGGDRLLYEKEQRRMLREEKEESRKARLQETIPEEPVTLASSSSIEDRQHNEMPVLEFSASHSDASDSDVGQPGPSKPKRKRGLQQVITPKLVATLDACQVSDRDAVRIITATAQALGHDTNTININRTSIRRFRTQWRVERNQILRSAFPRHEIDSLTVHWDGKMLPSLTGKEKVERLAVVITFKGSEHLLGIPIIESSSGRDQAFAVCNLLEEWDLSTKVQALSCDTTASNMGRLQGACPILEHEIGRTLLYLPCRHHIYEIILRAVFDEKMCTSSGPNIPIFKRFQQAWSGIHKFNFNSGMENPFVAQNITNAPEIINFAMETLQLQQPREDYRELVELVLLFLGRKLPQYHFRVPGAFHHARWMAKGIYCLKIFLFRKQFQLTEQEENGIRDICIFIANLYVKAWIEAPIPTKAPQQDLKFMQDLHKYKETDEDISRVTLHKFCRHLWYLTPETAALSFFSSDISIEIKKKMVDALNIQDNSDDNNKKFVILTKDVNNFLEKDITHFISSQSLELFKRFSIPTEFLKNDPATWESDPSYKIGVDIIKLLPVVNDCAERAVKLMGDFNQVLARTEEEKQFILQTITNYRKQFPDVRKCTLEKNIEI